LAYKILVVDDEKDIVEFVSSKLEREGYLVAAAYDGEEALSQVKESDPDVILLDLMMPKLNGFEVLKVIREELTEKWRPVIIISANAELESVKKCYNMEADHYLTKPCSMETILRGIQTVLSLIPLRIK
jgi:two-component system, OmpR family, response regulator VicR